MYRNLRNRSTVPALFAQMASLHPDKPALIYEATGEVRTRQQMQLQPHRLRRKPDSVTDLNISPFSVVGFVPGLDFQGAAGAVPRRGPLGSGSGVG